jgi:hypothetical protein
MGKILLLHGMPPKKFRFKGVENLELLFKRKFNSEEIVEHNFYINPPKSLIKFDFDAIILTSTFLGKISHPKTYRRIKEKYSFIKNQRSLKIGLPQDDYWAQETRDNWYSENLDILISVFQRKYWAVLYPKSIEKKVKIIKGHTTYINKDSFTKINYKEFNQREYDVVYRTMGLPYFPNKIGLTKSLIGDFFLKKHKDDFKLNISHKEKDLIFGDDWIKFLANSKSVLGSSSGSSVILRNHHHISKLEKAKKDKMFNYEKFEKSFFNKKDRNYNLTDISPRNIEAAKTMTLQILVEGDYGGILKKNIDYFCLKEDLSNSEELINLLNNPLELNKITKNCFERIINSESLNEDNLFDKIKREIHFFISKNPKQSKKFKLNKVNEFLKYQIFVLKFNFKELLKFFLA